ncbi:13204_t:CDS:2, partial [Gigaspora margarita]
MAKQIKLVPSSPNLASAYDLVLTDLQSKLVKMKEGMIKLGKLGTIHKKQRFLKSALNGRTYAYYQTLLLVVAVVCVGLYFYGQHIQKDSEYLKYLPAI